MNDKILSLTPHVRAIVCDKHTERPNSALITNANTQTYLCRRCGLALFRADAEFHSGCGWPSFDTSLTENVKKIPDADGQRTEILCTQCDAHLGHIFTGEGYTAKNQRYCVNSLSLDAVSDAEILDTEEAIVAGGCFWGVEYLFQTQPGVIKTEVGYIGGHVLHPTYENVCNDNTGHFEALRIVFNPLKTTYENIVRYFFEIHDPTQLDGQGPDKGVRYQSAIFYFDEIQKNIAQKTIDYLKSNQTAVVTELYPMNIFWRAEEYHQHYYEKTQKTPYCHHWKKRF